MTKSILKLALLILVIGVISILVYKVISKTRERNAIANSIKTIPAFTFRALNNQQFTRENLKLNRSTVFLYFNSECDFCQLEAAKISDAIDDFKYVQLVFVSTEPMGKIKLFSENYKLNNKENIVFLNDSNDDFSNLFNATSIPFILIYDKNQTLKKIHKGQLTVKSILKIANN